MSFQVIARSVAARPMARLICDVQLADGSPYPLCVRSGLKRVLGGIASEAVTFYVGATMTHRWLAEPMTPVPLRDPRRQQALADQTAAMLDALAIPWRSHSRQSATSGRVDPSRWSFELDGVDPLTLSDGLVTLRRLALTQAHTEGCGATWMPHPWEGVERAGLELAVSRVSSADGGLPSFGDPLHASGLSVQARAVAAAIAAEVPALSLVLRGTANSYTQPDPIEVVAAPMSRSEAGASLVLRGADASTNPYVALAVTLAIAHRSALSPHRESAPQATAQTLVEAARAAEVSRVMADVLGGELVGSLIRCARKDAARWRSQVTNFEVERYL
jgi:glutamine synthetase